MGSESAIQGPLGIWTYPLLNALIQMSGANKDNSSNSGGKTVETAEVIRDSNGEVQRVIVIKE